MKWFKYTSRHAAGTIECPPQFYDFPEKWPIRNNEPMMLGYSRRTELVLSLEVLGYMKDKRVRNDKVFYTRSLDKDGLLTGDIKEGYVMKNDPLLKKMLVSPIMVLIVEGKFLDEQLKGIDVTTISYFQLRPEHCETSRRGKHKRATEQPEGERDESEDEDDRFNIRIQGPSKKTKVVKKKPALIGGPSDPFLNRPNGRVNLVCIPISTGVVMKGDTLSLMGTDWKVNDLYFSGNKLFLEVEKRDFFKSTVPINYIKKECISPVEFHPAMPFYEEHSLIYWAYSNSRHMLMHSFNGASRVKDIRRDVAPCTPATLHAFGIRDSTVTCSVKYDTALSTASWDTILGDERDKVAEGTAEVMSIKF